MSRFFTGFNRNRDLRKIIPVGRGYTVSIFSTTGHRRFLFYNQFAGRNFLNMASRKRNFVKGYLIDNYNDYTVYSLKGTRYGS